MFKFLETVINKTDSRKYYKNYNSPISVKEIEFIIEKHFTVKIPYLNDFIGGLFQTFKLGIIHNYF